MDEVTLKFSRTDVQNLMTWVTSFPLPYRDSSPFIQKMAQQLQAQGLLVQQPQPPANGAENAQQAPNG